MCFSATASFTAGAVLVPLGAWTLNRAWRSDRSYLALASFPLFLGIQQLFEGLLWLNLEGNPAINGRAAALGFLFFAYFLWPFFVSLSANLVERQRLRSRVFLLFTLLGLLIGTSLYVPLFIDPEWLTVSIEQGSILYSPVSIYDGYASRDTMRAIYAVIVALPLLFSSVAMLRLFGILIFASVVVSVLLFTYAFVSVWCFFAAILSVFILCILHRET
jgi:hypothetical protein